MQNKETYENDPLAYDRDLIPPETQVLSVVQFLAGKPQEATDNLKKINVPSVALWDLIMKCTEVAQNYYSNPANRDCNKPREDWNIIAVIPARGGSKGVPLKALRVLNGKTSLQIAIDACRRIKHVKRIIVNTDSPEIAEHARAYGAEVPYLRPKELAEDTSSLEEAVMFSRYWLNLIEEQCYDVFVVVSAVTPLLDPDEINEAMDRLARHKRPSCQVAAALASCSIEYLGIDDDGLLSSFCDMQPHRSASYASQFGAFSLHSLRPYYQIQPHFRPHISEVSPPPPHPLTHLLPANQGLEIDEMWDLDACRILLGDEGPVRRCRDEELRVTRSQAAGNEVSFRSPLCLVSLPPREQCLEVDGVAAIARVVGVAKKSGQENVILWGDADEWGGDGELFGCPFRALPSGVMPDDVRHLGGMARQETAAMLREQLSIPRDVPLLMLDGRAGLLREDSVRAVMAKAGACPGEAVVSVSPPLVHPFYLKNLKEDGSLVPAIEGDASMRQNLPKAYSRDGVLCFSPSGHTQGRRGVVITKAEGWVLRDIFDGVRALTLAQHTLESDAEK